MKTSTSRHDNFLADAIKKPRERHLNYMDGFRFGVGFFVSVLFMAIILGGLTWAFIVAFKLH